MSKDKIGYKKQPITNLVIGLHEKIAKSNQRKQKYVLQEDQKKN